MPGEIGVDGSAFSPQQTLANAYGLSAVPPAPMPQAPPPNPYGLGANPSLADSIAAIQARNAQQAARDAAIVGGPGGAFSSLTPPSPPPIGFAAGANGHPVWRPGDRPGLEYARAEDSGVFKSPAAPAAGGGGAPLTKVGAAWTPTERSSQVQGGVNFSPETMDALNASAAHGREAVGQQTEAERAKNEREQRLGQYDVTMQGAEDAQERWRKQAQFEQMHSDRQKLQQMSEDVASQKIDPDRYWKNASVGTKIATGISLALGGFLMGATGRNIGALDHLNKLQDQDIDAQRQAIASGKEKLENAKGLYGMALQQFGNEDQAAAAARMAAKEQRGKEIQTMMLGSNDSLLRARGQQLLAQNERQIAEDRKSFEQLSSSKTTTQSHEKFTPEHYVGGAGTTHAGGAGAIPGVTYDAAGRAIGPNGKPLSNEELFKLQGEAKREQNARAGQIRVLEEEKQAREAYDHARSRPWDRAGLAAAESVLKSKMMISQQTNEGISATDAHVHNYAAAIPGWATPGGSHALAEQNKANDERIRALRAGAPLGAGAHQSRLTGEGGGS